MWISSNCTMPNLRALLTETRKISLLIFLISMHSVTFMYFYSITDGISTSQTFTFVVVLLLKLGTSDLGNTGLNPNLGRYRIDS